MTLKKKPKNVFQLHAKQISSVGQTQPTPPLTQGQEEEWALLQLHLLAWGQTSWLHHDTCPAQETAEELFHSTPAHGVPLLHPAEL